MGPIFFKKSFKEGPILQKLQIMLKIGCFLDKKNPSDSGSWFSKILKKLSYQLFLREKNSYG